MESQGQGPEVNLSPHQQENLVALIDKLKQYHDEYNRKFPVSNAANKTDDLDIEVKKVLRIIDEAQSESSISSSELMVLRAKALNVMAGFHPEIIDVLGKLVKRYPSCVEAWNILGETFWRNNDLKSAKNCFQVSLNQKRTAVSLRSLSLLLRSLPGTPAETFQNLSQSIEHAREAVALDPEDGSSWYFLGNAYAALFFKHNQDPDIMDKMLKSYAKASQCSDMEYIAELHFNRAVAYNYSEDFYNALTYFKKAHISDPWWEEPSRYYNDLKTFLLNVNEQVGKKGYMKPTRLRKLVSSLTPSVVEKNIKLLFKETSKENVTHFVEISALNVGENKGKAIVGKVVSCVYSPEPITFTFCIVDSKESCIAVNAYNVAKGKGVVIGDTVAIPGPLLKKIEFQFDEQEYLIRWIKVHDPLTMAVNGKWPNQDFRASPSFEVTISHN